MLSTSECLLKADNFVIAARIADPDDRMRLMEQAAYWRRMAFQLQMERFGPFSEDSDMTARRDQLSRGLAD